MDIPICECAAFWKVHHDECPVQREILQLRATIERLRAETDNGVCACGYDDPADVCLYHSPVVEQLKAAIEKLRGYARHDPSCKSWGRIPHPCDCGYDTLMKEIGG